MLHPLHRRAQLLSCPYLGQTLQESRALSHWIAVLLVQMRFISIWGRVLYSVTPKGIGRGKSGCQAGIVIRTHRNRRQTLRASECPEGCEYLVEHSARPSLSIAGRPGRPGNVTHMTSAP